MNRIQRGAQALKTQNIPALLIGKRENIYYLTGFRGDDSRLLLTAAGDAYIFTDGRFLEEAEQAENCTVCCQQPGKGHPALLGEIVTKAGIDIIAFEGNSFTYGEYDQFRQALHPCEIKPAYQVIEALRTVKDPEELELIQQAEAIGDAAFDAVLPQIKPGMTEKQLAECIRRELFAAGGEDLSFPVIAASGPNCSICHAQPGERLLQPGDLVLMDFGCVYKGYCSDMTRTVCLHSTDDLKAEMLYHVVRAAQNAAFEAIAPGVPLSVPHMAAVKVFTEAGLADKFVHSLGHGVGLEIHEDPRMAPAAQGILQPGQVVSVEPGLYLPGFGGVRIEDLVTITEHGYHNLTHSTKEFLLL